MQGVGFRPFAYRLARRYALAGWVRNGDDGVEIHVEGAEDDLASFERALRTDLPPAAEIVALDRADAELAGCAGFAIRTSDAARKPTVRMSPDLAACAPCLTELFDRANRRYRYPYITCTDCGPRYSIVLRLPYDRPSTTMAGWPMCAECRREYEDPGDRRFHAQPIACHACGPAYRFESGGTQMRGDAAIVAAARALGRGAIVAVKGIGGYHLACDARDASAVTSLRERKFRKDRPFAVMPRDLASAERLVALDAASRALLTSSARPIVLARALVDLPHVAPVIVRRSRGFAPQAVTRLPPGGPIVAVGGDLKNAVAIVVDDAVIASQHVGDLAHLAARQACAATLRDLCATSDVDPAECLVACDAHPEYVSSALARELSRRTLAVQHHRAHVAGVVAEREAWSTEVLGLACDGTGYGDDGTIWGGECFAGSVAGGFERIAHLRRARLPGGDAAARFPVQAAAGFLYEFDDLPDFEAPPFGFPARYRHARAIARGELRTFVTTSLGRLFDAVAALCGFTGEATFEGQAAIWLEHRAAGAAVARRYAFPLVDDELDYRPLLRAIVADRRAGRDPAEIALGFHIATSVGLGALAALRRHGPVVASGGVFTNRMLCELLRERLGERLWLGSRVPSNDGGLCIGQAALAAFSPARRP
ncbi:MAG: hypothetical protein NVSMB21_23060 [Vulcanimicrobiaceae bacterium]